MGPAIGKGIMMLIVNGGIIAVLVCFSVLYYRWAEKRNNR